MIAIFLPNFGLGGAERVMIALAEEFTRMGHRVDLVVLENQGPLTDSLSEKVNVVSLDVRRLRKAIFPICAYLRANRPDGVITNIWPLTLVVAIASRVVGRMKLVTVHQNNIDQQYVQNGRVRRPLLKLAIRLERRLANFVVGCSDGVVCGLSKVSGLSETDFTLQANPVRIAPEPASKTLSEAEQMWRVPRGGRFLAVGNLKAQKNYDLMLRAFALIATPERQLIIFGEGDQRHWIERLREKLCLGDRVDLPGQTLVVEAFYRTADVFVMSSDFEGLPTVLIEALGSGLSIVSTDCPFGPSEILENGRFGRLVQTNDVGALANAMEETLRKPFEPADLRRRADDYAPELTAMSYLRMLGFAAGEMSVSRIGDGQNLALDGEER